MEEMYMNMATGSVGNYDSWWYENAEGEEVNAVDLEEVVIVKWNESAQYWEAL